MSTTRRSVFKRIAWSVTGFFTWTTVWAGEKKNSAREKQVAEAIETGQDIPVYSSAVVHGDTIYLAGKIARIEGDIKAQTTKILDDIEKELVKNGSSMEKVLKVSVFLKDMNDYAAMNEAYRGRFGKNPPVRTTVAVAAIPLDSLIEIDCIAAK